MRNRENFILTREAVRRMIPQRHQDSHKGQNGHVLIVAGSRGMSGAAILAAMGALKIGAGLVTVAIVESERLVVTRRLPEALTLSLPGTPQGLLAERAINVLDGYRAKRAINAVAIGPGLGVDHTVQRVIKWIMKKWDIPLLLDADGLNNLQASDLKGYPCLIITPHPGELSRLTHLSRGAVIRERQSVAKKVALEQKLCCVLKGHHTVITDGKITRINPTGNPAMATGGMGDVLTGAIAGLLAQGASPFEAACAGVFLHGLAGDLIRVSNRGLLATELAQALPRSLAKIGVV